MNEPTTSNLTENMNKKETIFQSVYFGSIYLALSKQLFTTRELLNWLPDAYLCSKTLIAYKVICESLTLDKQYLDDDVHFLAKAPNYAGIIANDDMSLLIPEVQNVDDSPPIISRICNILIEYRNEPPLIDFINLFHGRGSIKYLRDNINTCYGAHNFPHLRLDGHSINVALIEVDWIDKFRYNNRLAKLIIKRMHYLRDKATIYYDRVARGAYLPIVKKLYKDKLLIKLSKVDLIELDTIFPNIIDSQYLSCNDLSRKILSLGNEIAGYLLGFPIQYHTPTDTQLHSALEQLSLLKRDDYASFVTKNNENFYLMDIPFIKERTSFANIEDVVVQKIDNYSAFDIVAYRDGNHIYRFTRPEFKALLKSGKNHWTNDWLPVAVASIISSRKRTAKSLNLPKSSVLSELLRQIEEDDLQEESTEDETEDEEMDLESQNIITDIIFRYLAAHEPNSISPIPENISSSMPQSDTTDDNLTEGREGPYRIFWRMTEYDNNADILAEINRFDSLNRNQ